MIATTESSSDSLLRLLPEEDRNRFLKKTIRKSFAKGDQIVRENDRDSNFYIIDSGRVRVTLFSSEGKEVSFIDLAAGENFGELSVIDGLPRSANVIALADTQITIVPAQQFVALLETNPQVCFEILKQVTGIVRRLCDRIFEYSTLDVLSRICLEILRLAEGNIDLDGVARISNPPTQTEMASRISCAREGVSRELARLEKTGIISKASKKLIVNDLSRLEELASVKPIT